jgi:hypothetical protein
MTTYTHQTAPTQFVEARGNPFRLSPFRQSPRRAARFQPAFPRDYGLLGSGRNPMFAMREYFSSVSILAKR